MKSILHTVDIQATPDVLYRALATENGLAGWWSTRVRAQMRVGGFIEFAFVPTFNPRMELTALEEPRRVAWRCVGGHEPWADNTFSFEVEARGDGAILFFRQDYSRELDDEEYGRYAYNWGYYLHSLKLLCETGVGRPHGASPDDLKAVVVRFVDRYKNEHDPDVVDELVAADCKVHIPLPGLPGGREGLRVNGRLMCGAFPDVRVAREFFVVDGNIVVERAEARATHKGELMGTPASGNTVSWTELHAYRVEDGQITEIWSEADFVGVLTQIGALPPLRG